MTTGRLEAFSDGVLAIIITIMVLGLAVPQGGSFAAFFSTVGTGLLGYVLSFAYVGIYWNNHHHMFQVVERVTGPVLWANLHLLFWLSLLPLTTAWLDSTGLAPAAVIVYGTDLLLCAVAYFLLQSAVLRAEGAGSRLRRLIGRDWKGHLSPALYAVGIALGAAAFALPGLAWGSVLIYAGVAVMWIVPDRRIERGVAPYPPPTERNSP
ncbi:Uncharacterized membrane protein [Paramicrobacterium humi]|uniref:Uncharacterized membrane protein n=1 Tax=Paramicrobacterium humi TaxID=640635 RepID=A0A1H4JK67_9MICO|nr:TMEM175 family protein [Microbacterium humi]SEB46724.1 Uncharacterized membrane protein [Microbacterium humi]